MIERKEGTMQIGLIGLGKMGGNMAERLRADGHEVIGYDRNPASPRTVDSLPALAAALAAPRVVWVMVPSGEPTRATIADLAEVLEAGDVIIDGGNSRYTDDQLHAAALQPEGDPVPRRRGVRRRVGAHRGLRADGRRRFRRLSAIAQPIFDALKPPGDSGFVHAGPVGAGHFTKMVHNGIEYGIMQAYGEGYELLKAADMVTDPDAVMASWQQGTVIRSWLLDLLVRAMDTDPELAEIRRYARGLRRGPVDRRGRRPTSPYRCR